MCTKATPHHRHHCPKQITPWSQNSTTEGVFSLDQSINTFVFSKQQQLTSLKGLNMLWGVALCMMRPAQWHVHPHHQNCALSAENHTWIRTWVKLSKKGWVTRDNFSALQTMNNSYCLRFLPHLKNCYAVIKGYILQLCYIPTSKYL